VGEICALCLDDERFRATSGAAKATKSGHPPENLARARPDLSVKMPIVHRPVTG